MDAAVKTEGKCPDAAGLQLTSSPWSAAVVAGAHLMSGKGDAAKWARQYEENGGDLDSLRSASELSFAADSRTSYSLEDDVMLQLYTKNTGTEGVLVKVYALNCWKLYTSTQDEPDLNLELAGVAATHTITLSTPADPMIRCRHSVPLGLQGVPGVWLVEVVAGSRRLRARISKGGLRLLQRPSVAGQVLTVMDEEWRPVKGVKCWCDGKEYVPHPAGDGGSADNQVLLPFAREEGVSALVVSAQLLGTAAAGGGKECVVLCKDFRRLKEQYNLGAQLFCHQEALLPGHPLQLLLLLNLQLHGTPAPLRLLQDMQLSITAHTSEGGPVTQLIQDMVLDEGTCTAQVSYTLPQHTTSLSAALTARVLLALPGTNAEPGYQQFDVQELLPGQTSLQHSIDIEGARQSSDIWDVYLTSASTTPAEAGTGHPATYMLQVLGRCGEAPTARKTVSVWLDHIAFNPQHQLKFRVQTGPGGVVQLGHLQGVRQIRAQIEDGVDCVEKRRGGGAAGYDGAGGGAPGEHAGPVRSWQIARPSWWVGGLQEQYFIAEGSSIEVPITPPAGQTITATLLQLVSPAMAAKPYGSSTATDAVVTADVTADHLQLHPASLGSSSSSGSSSLLGCGGPTTIRIQGLKAGLYRLLLSALLLKPGSGGAGSMWGQSARSRSMAVHIHVLPATVTARSAEADSTAAGASGDAHTTAAADASMDEQWLYAGPDFSSIDSNKQQPLLLQPSLPRQLHVTSLECSVTSGLSLQVAGPDQLLSTAQVLLVFSRFLPDSTISAAQLLPPQLPWSTRSNSSPAFGFNPSLADQVTGWGFDSDNREGLGYGACPQPCESPASCAYSQDAKLDSAVAYVLQRRQWEASGAGRRPGVLLDRPSLLVFPHSVRSAAAATSVLRGGDGGLLSEMKMMKKKQASGGAPPRKELMRECLFGAAPQECAAYGGPCYAGIALARQAVAASTPVLGFLAQPAAVLTRLQLGPDGALQLSAEQLQQLLSEAVGLTAGGATAGQSVWDVTGCRVAYAAVFDPRTLGQFGAAWCAVQGQQQQDSQGERAAEAADVSSCLPPAAVRDMGLDRPVDPAVVSALSCDVVVLRQPGASLSLHNPEAAEAGVYGSLQQMYHLLAGLMKAAESGGVTMQPYHGGGPGILQGLPRPCVPPGTQESASVLLRQWEPLLLQWPLLGAAARHDLISKLASSELLFFLAVKDKPAYEELLLPMLRCKLPSELSCLDQILLLQAQHNQPPIPVIQQPQEQQQAGAVAHMQASPAVNASYDVHKQGLLQHWYAPHRYKQLNCLERLLLAALEGREALMQFSTDLMYQLQSPAEKRGIKHTWMSRERRTVFEFALLLAQSLEQQHRDTQDSTSGSDHQPDADTEDEGHFGDTAGGSADEDNDFVKVDRADAKGATGGGMFGGFSLGGAPMPAPAMMAPMMAMAVPPPPPPAPGASLFGAMAPPAPSPARAMAARHTADLSARARIALEASDESNQVGVPKETKEWAETGWWKCDGPQPQLVPVSRFWAEFAGHLATQPPGTPFVPSDPTDVAASTAAIVATLAVTDLPWEGAVVSSSAAGSSCSGSSKGRVKASSVGCSRSYQGATVTLTARAPCLLWVKMMKPLVSVSPESIPAGAASATPTASAVGGGVGADNAAPEGQEWITVPGATSSTAGAATATAAAPCAGTRGASVANAVLVVDRLYDSRYASSTDPETGEEVLLALQPSEQQPLLTGQRYCRSVVVTSTVAAERDLQLLVQLPQGAMALNGSVGTISRDIKLAPYTSMQVQQTFYFPQPGVYQQAPVSVVTLTGRPAWVPSAPAAPLHVVDAANVADDNMTSAEPDGPRYMDPAARWRQRISKGDKQELLTYLRTGDLTGARLSDVSRFCKDPAFFDAAVAALNSRHVYKQGIWKWSVVHLHAPALKQLLMNSQIAQKLQTQYKVPVARFLDSVFGHSSSSGSGSDAAAEWVLCEQVVRHLEYWPWINPYCRPITHSGSDANLPSVLRDNPAISQQWKSFLLSLLMDCTPHHPSSSIATTAAGGSGSSGSSSSTVRRLTAQQAIAAAVFLLLQDRIDDAEEVLIATGCWDLGQGVVQEAASQQAMSGPLRMQLQRDYLAACLALCRPLAGPAAAGSVVGDSQESVTAEAVRVGKAVVNKYKGCVAGPWAKRFKQLATMVSQLEQQQAGASAAAAVLDGPDTAAAGLAVQPMLTVISLEGSTLKLHVAGLHQVQLAAYQIDTELLFTTQPFSSFSSSSSSQMGGSLGACPLREPPSHKQRQSAADGGLGRVSYVQPTAQVQVQLQYSRTTSTADPAVDTSGSTPGPSSCQYPAQPHALSVSCSPVGVGHVGAADSAGAGVASASGVFECVLDLDGLMPCMRQLSVLLEVTGGALSRSLPRFASALTVHVLENQGMLQAYFKPQQGTPAAGQGGSGSCGLTPAAAVYVKVYARDAGGDEFFYKDGYTDLRGRFDYVTLTSTADMSRVVRYSLLVAAREQGAVMMQAAPPAK